MLKRKGLNSGGAGIAGLAAGAAAEGTANNLKKPGGLPTRPTVKTGGGASFANVEVHFRGNWKVLTLSRKWSKEEILENLCNSFNIGQSDRDGFDLASLSICVFAGPDNEPEAAQNDIEDFTDLQDG